jgi:hypothetical protein
MPITFLHLSDLHFREEDLHSQVNPDADIRNELLQDLRRQKETHRIEAVLVSGDLAFAGRASEYKAVAEFLDTVCQTVGVDPSAVWTVPGNHDVDRSKHNRSVKLQHENLRQTARESQTALNQALRELLEDAGTAVNPLFAAIENYNAFADRYGCRSETRPLKWYHDFILDDQSVLRLHGLNSTLVSGVGDNEYEGKLVLGSPQWLIPNEQGVSHLVMCHHPLDWLHEHDEIDDFFQNRIQLLLCGHKHTQRRRSSGYTVVHSGALHPERDEAGWDPRYNIIQISVDGQGQDRRLLIYIFERQWQVAEKRFGAVLNPVTEEKYYVYRHDLPPWQKASAYHYESAEGAGVPTPVSEQKVEPQNESPRLTRALLYRFYSLPLQQRIDIVSDMHLIEDTDQTLSTQDLQRRTLERAKREGKVRELIEAIRKCEEQQ